jgi:UPF0755 protein
MKADAGTTPSRGNGIGAPRADDSAAFGGHRVTSERLSPRSPRTALEPDRLPEPLRPSRRARNPFIVIGSALFTIIILATIVVGFALAAGRQRFDIPGPLDQDKVVHIPRGSGLRDIAEQLQREGVIGASQSLAFISQSWVFIGGVVVRKAYTELKAGEYEFHKQASMSDVLNTLIEGKVILHSVTIPEGLTSEQIVARLMEAPILTGNIKEIPKEGTLLPETYNFNRGTTREQIVAQMQQKQRDLLQKVWERRASDLPIKMPEQLVVLASIVEKETGRADERTRVAAVFVNRLKQRMRLQSDPTIIYGLVGGKGTLGRPIMRSEIEQPTPYNTYVIDGLPPGPIANPGRASLEAAANPARTKELYFVADGTGGHAFSETLDQHQKSVARLRQLEQQQREATKEPTDPPAFAPVPQRSMVPVPTAAPTRQPAAARSATPPKPKPPHGTIARPAEPTAPPQ